MSEPGPAAPRISTRDLLLIAAGLITAVIFITTTKEENYWLHVLSKPIPVLIMALWLGLLPRKGRYQWAVFAGLLLSAAGDLLLSISDETFLFGLISFLLGHVAYIVAFLGDSRRLNPIRGLLAYAYGAVAYGALYTVGDLGDMTIPVLAYVIVICTMLWRAFARVGEEDIPARSARIGLAGAAFFTLSDTLLAFGLFAGQRPFGPYAVMLTYWVGQLGITLSAAWQNSRSAVSNQRSAPIGPAS
jgi:uncharacterized membrane protein YhhN